MCQTFSCLSMTVRNKRSIARQSKSAKAQWLSLDLKERRLICEAAANTKQELIDFSDLVHRLIRMRCGDEPEALSSEQQQAASPPVELPAHLAANARALGIELTENRWRLLAEDERYALMKLGGGQRIKRKFAIALKEFLPD